MGTGIILVAGVSGVGKTTLCQRVAANERGIHHLIASSFVSGQRATDQVELVARIRAAAQGLGGTTLVDGHLIVGGIKVPLEAVAALAPRAIVVVTAHPRDIVSRRTSDGNRTRSTLTEDEIHHAQTAEVQWARELASAIGVPLAEISCQNSDGSWPALRHLLGIG